MTEPSNLTSVSSRLLRRIRGWGRGRVFVPRDLLDLATRETVDVTLHRLVRDGVIRRLGRGIYDYPKTHDRLGLLSPSADEIASAVSRSCGCSIVRSGAAAANFLGLSTQVPARPLYLTDGSSRTLKIGKRSIQFRHASPSRMLGGDTTVGAVIRALRYLGRDAVTDAQIDHLRSVLNDQDRSALLALKPQVPTWVQRIISRIVADDSTVAA